MIRKVELDDFNKNHVQLYQQLSTTESIDPAGDFEKYKLFINSLNDQHQIFVIEHENKIIATITVLVEQKIIHSMGKILRIEDVVVDFSHKKKGLGKQLIDYAVNYAKEKSCYKVVLICSDDNIEFYKKCSFSQKNNSMTTYF